MALGESWGVIEVPSGSKWGCGCDFVVVGWGFDSTWTDFWTIFEQNFEVLHFDTPLQRNWCLQGSDRPSWRHTVHKVGPRSQSVEKPGPQGMARGAAGSPAERELSTIHGFGNNFWWRLLDLCDLRGHGDGVLMG